MLTRLEGQGSPEIALEAGKIGRWTYLQFFLASGLDMHGCFLLGLQPD